MAGPSVFTVSHGVLSVGMWCLVPRPRIKHEHPALGAWSLDNWTDHQRSPSGILILLAVFFLIIYLFIFDCAESSLLCVGFLQLQRARATLYLWFMDSLRWLLLCVAPEHIGFSTCGAQVQLLSSLWDLPGPGVELVSPAFQGGFLTT